MPNLDLESSLELRRVDETTYENVHPPWVWHPTKVVPGAWLMSQCAAAAYETVGDDVALDSLHTQFLAGAKPDPPIRFIVHKLSDGRRFAVRSVIAVQNDRAIVATTISFVSSAAKSQPAMIHRVERETRSTISEICLDDLEPKTPLGPFMKFQRLEVYRPDPVKRGAQYAVTVCAAHISPSIKRPAGCASHILGILNLSDYHVLDAPPQIYDVSVGLFAIDDHSRTPVNSGMKMMASLNHTIHFHRHGGWRADEMCYIEAKTPCGNGGRTLIETKIFDLRGALIATCVQEGFHVFKEGTNLSKL